MRVKPFYQEASFWLGICLLSIGILAVAFLAVQKPKESKAARAVWTQGDWSGGSGALLYQAKSNRYWSKTVNLSDKEGISFILGGEVKKNPPKETGEGQEIGSQSAQEKKENELLTGNLVSSILDVEQTTTWSGGELVKELPQGTKADLYLQVGSLKDSVTEGEAKVNYEKDINWSEWVKLNQEELTAHLKGRFARYQVRLTMPANGSQSPRVRGVNVFYLSEAKKEIDPNQSIVEAESPVLIGDSSQITIQLFDQDGEIVLVPNDSLMVKTTGLEGVRVSKPQLNEAGAKSFYSCSAVSQEIGKAKVIVSVDLNQSSSRTGGGNQGDNPAEAGEIRIVLTDQPEINFVSSKEAKHLYLESGWLRSSIFNAESKVKWGKATYEAKTPEDTKIVFEVRAGDHNDALGEWREVKSGTDLNSNAQYFQYRVALFADSDGKFTPEFKNLKIEYSSRGTQKEISDLPKHQVGEVDLEKSSVAATTPHRAGLQRSKVLIRVKDTNGNPISGFLATQLELKTEPKAGTVFYQQMKATDSEGRITYECGSTTVGRKHLKTYVKDLETGELFKFKDEPVIDFVGADEDVYLKSGELNSSIYDAGDVVKWDRIRWNADVPARTHLRVMVIAGNDFKMLNRGVTDIRNWREVKNGEMLKIKARYLKYKVLFNNDDPHFTPVLKRIRVEYHS
jgi:hypothetical protein